jgi:5-hydroxyisourate hydrolase
MSMQGMSIHVVDTTRGRAAAGMRVEVFALAGARRRLVDAVVGPRGAVDDRRLLERLLPGPYEVAFHAADYFRAAGTPLSARPFLEVVHFQFGIAHSDRHYHLPFKTTPWGYSCFLGA